MRWYVHKHCAGGPILPRVPAGGGSQPGKAPPTEKRAEGYPVALEVNVTFHQNTHMPSAESAAWTDYNRVLRLYSEPVLPSRRVRRCGLDESTRTEIANYTGSHGNRPYAASIDRGLSFTHN
jgi:hypothetical protein